ncbi:MAG: aminopeptidase P N-terminal domain-containing protein [Bacteroidetes bacterium]|nr:aminopeptidase P N-terminal domain-containing protein [Bacteroidota bacterium]
MRTLLFFVLVSVQLWAQQDSLYDQDWFDASFHKGRREALRQKMAEKSVAVVFAAAERNRSNDVDYQYSQDPNFYYLTGLTEPNAVLLIFKEPQTIDSITTTEILYVQPRSPHDESWTGKRLGVQGAKKKLGFADVYTNDAFSDLSLDFKKMDKIYHSYFYDDVRDDKLDAGDLYSLIKTFIEKTKNLSTKDSYGLSLLMADLREIKTPEELIQMQKAIDITCLAHQELMKKMQHNTTEYQAQAIVEYGFKYNGSEYVGYPSIVGAGENSCILHYITNRKKLTKNDIMVVDAGAEYHGYTADVTRSLPISGTFSEEQKKIYNLVLKAQLAGIEVCKEGNLFRSAHNAAVEVIKKGLMDLGIISAPNEFAKYFFHGTSHYLGLDVHDVGNYGRLKANQVITVEPGIYIPENSPCDKKWWNIGVRIEDDVLITNDKPRVMSGKLPKTVEEIEALMKK